MTHPVNRSACPVLKDSQRAARTGEELLRSLRRLRRALLACEHCPGYGQPVPIKPRPSEPSPADPGPAETGREVPSRRNPGFEACPLRAEFNLTIDSLVAEINAEWERA